MKKGKLLTLVGTAALMSAGSIAFSSCSKSNIDTTKTQLYILNYQGGYGKKYIENAASRYAEMYKDKSFQDGKKGLQIIITEQKAQPEMAALKNDKNQLIIFEGMVYKNLIDNNICADITQYITGNNPYETGKTIESKMYDEQKTFFKDNGKYYVIPNYVGSFGIVYNKTVFNENGYYFVSDYEEVRKDPNHSLGDLFTSDPTDRSIGPDGKADTWDDGLPVTYEDYYDLCSYIDTTGKTPLIWMGKNSQNYLTDLMSAVVANYDGYEAYKSNYLMDGTFEACVLDADGKPQTDAQGKLVTENVTTHSAKQGDHYDGYEIQRSASKYHAMEFIKEVVDHEEKGAKKASGVWSYDKLYNTTTNIDAQRLFINSQFGTLPSFTKPNQPIAMLFEGNWWENEASETFAALTDKQKTELDYGWMPLPQHPDSKNKNKNTILNSLTSYMFVKSGLEDYQTKLAADFLQYLNTDEAYNEFTALTSAVKSFKYDITNDTKSKMTKFGQNFWEYFQGAEKIFPESHDHQFTVALSDQQLSRRYWAGTTMSWPSLNFESDANETPATYMQKMYKHYRDDVWKTLA